MQESVTGKYDQLISQFYFGNERALVLDAVEAQFRHDKLANGHPGKQVVLVLTKYALVVHFNGLEWNRYTGHVPAKQSTNIFFSTMVDDWTITDNRILHLKPVFDLARDWRGQFIFRAESGFAEKFDQLAREAIRQAKLEEVERLERKLEDRKRAIAS